LVLLLFLLWGFVRATSVHDFLFMFVLYLSTRCFNFQLTNQSKDIWSSQGCGADRMRNHPIPTQVHHRSSIGSAWTLAVGLVKHILHLEVHG
jgi:hypothetical protein